MSFRANHDDEHFIPAVHALHLAEVAQRFGVSRAKLFATTGVTEAVALDPRERISVRTTEKLVERARTLTGEPMLGLLLGMQMRISAHGYLGFAAMAASTVGDALEIATRFAPTRTNALALRVSVAGSVASLVIEELASFGTARDVVILALIEGIRQIGQALTGRPLDGRAEVAFPAPSYASRVPEERLRRVRFGRPHNQIVFDAGVLDCPLVMADPAAFTLATEQCERELESMRARGALTGKVRVALRRRTGEIRSLEGIAAALGLSTRTLKRKLAAEGTTFRALAEEARRERALLLLQSTDLSLDAIAERVGYSDVANFTRAFRKWTGTTPAKERAASKA